jgi:hypothetical protein
MTAFGLGASAPEYQAWVGSSHRGCRAEHPVFTQRRRKPPFRSRPNPDIALGPIHRPGATPPPPQKKPLCPFPPCSKLGAVVFNRKPSGPELPSLLSPVLWLLLRVQAFLCRRQPKTPGAPCTPEQAIAWLQHMLQAIDDFAQSARNGTLPPLTPSAATPPNTPSPHQDSQPAPTTPNTPSPHHEFPSAAPTPGAAHANSPPPAEKPPPHPTPPAIRAGKPQRPPENPPNRRRTHAPHHPTQAAAPPIPAPPITVPKKISRIRSTPRHALIVPL